jgi:hypothetical protein
MSFNLHSSRGIPLTRQRFTWRERVPDEENEHRATISGGYAGLLEADSRLPS